MGFYHCFRPEPLKSGESASVFVLSSVSKGLGWGSILNKTMWILANQIFFEMINYWIILLVLGQVFARFAIGCRKLFIVNFKMEL